MLHREYKIDGLDNLLSGLFRAVKSGVVRTRNGKLDFAKRIPVGPVAIRFKGSPIPHIAQGNGRIELTWPDGAEIDLPIVGSWADPDITSVLIGETGIVVYTRAGTITIVGGKS